MQGAQGPAGSGLAEAINTFWTKQTDATAVPQVKRDEVRLMDLQIMVNRFKNSSHVQAAAPWICSTSLLKEGMSTSNCTDKSTGHVSN